MEIPLERPTNTTGGTEGAVGLIAQGFFPREGLAPHQAWSLKSLALGFDVVAELAKADCGWCHRCTR